MLNKSEVEAGEYEKLRDKYEELVRVAVSISDKSGGIKTSNANIIANQIFTRIVLCSMTLGAILPDNSINHHTIWDYPSIANLTRMFVETCHRLFYITEAGLTDEQIKFRIDLFYYHLNSEKYKFYKQVNAPEDMLKSFEEKLPLRKDDLMNSEVFKNLNSHIQNKIKGGNTDMSLSDEAIAANLEFMNPHYKAYYRLLSNQAHGSPFVVLSQSNERGRGFRNNADEGYIVMMLILTLQYLSLSICRIAAALNLESVNPRGIAVAKEVVAGNFFTRNMN